VKIYRILPIAAFALAAQMAPTLKVEPLPTVKAAKGSETSVAIKASLPAGYHANSNKPSESYLIPLTLKWNDGPLQADSIEYPKPQQEHYGFQRPEDKPLSVVTGEFTIVTKFKVKPDASAGPAAQTGTLRYQACDNHACYAPKNVPVSITVSVQ
jgi:hypothetical protein